MGISTKIKKKRLGRSKRHDRVRRRIIGTLERPRLSVYKSANYIYAQLIDDIKAETLLAVSSLMLEIKSKIKAGCNIEAAKVVGKFLGEKAKEKGIKKAVFDRGGCKYHGKLKALADAAREAGLEF